MSSSSEVMFLPTSRHVHYHNVGQVETAHSGADIVVAAGSVSHQVEVHLNARHFKYEVGVFYRPRRAAVGRPVGAAIEKFRRNMSPEMFVRFARLASSERLGGVITLSEEDVAP